MPYTFAVIGPKPLVDDICEVMTEFPQIQPIKLIYESEQQAPILIQENKEIIDVYFFSGDVPYYLSQKVIPSHSRSIFIPFEGSEAYRAILQIYRHYHFFPIISFDGIPSNYLQEIYAEIEVPHIPFYATQKEGPRDSEELCEYHMALWKTGKAQVIATSIHSVYQRLKSQHLPVFLIKSTKQFIRGTMKQAILMASEQKKQLAQITVLQFKIQSEADENGVLKNCQKKIMEFSKQLFASMTSDDPYEYTLFTTRGIVEKMTKNLTSFSVFENGDEEGMCTFFLGIGIGETVERALYNANRALDFAVRHGGNNAYLIDDQMKVQGPLGTADTLEYSLIYEQKGDIASTSLRKLYSWLQMIQKNEVTTRDISVGMNMGERNAARMFQKMKEKGIAEAIGSESMSQRGRPRPIYRIDLQRLAQEVNGKNK